MTLVYILCAYLILHIMDLGFTIAMMGTPKKGEYTGASVFASLVAVILKGYMLFLAWEMVTK